MPEIETTYGSIKIEQYDFMGESKVTIATTNYAECEQTATLTREQFTKFIEQCQEILAHMPE